MLKHKIKFISPILLKITLYKLNQESFIFFQYKNFFFYFKMPNNTKLKKKKNIFIFYSNFFSRFTIFTLRKLYLNILKIAKENNKLYCKKLLLKGLGFKVINIVQNSYLELKLGFSHFVKIQIPQKENLTLYSKKNMIIIEGPTKHKVGNFANKIKSFRLPDSYKGKGIWYKKETKILKEIKKK